jgi:DNA repair protein RadC
LLGGLADTAGGTPHYFGHRERLRQRLIEAGAESLPDYELLEVLLFANDPRKDVKPLAKALLERFGGFSEVLTAEPDALRAAGLREPALAVLKAVREAALRLGRAELRDRELIGSWDRLIAFCNAHIAYSQVEEFHILFLDRKNGLIRHEPQQKGTVDHTPVYTREVVKRALELQASALILVHNHPFRRPDPVEGRHRGDPRHRQCREAARDHRARPRHHRPRPPYQPQRSRPASLTADNSTRPAASSPSFSRQHSAIAVPVSRRGRLVEIGRRASVPGSVPRVRARPIAPEPAGLGTAAFHCLFVVALLTPFALDLAGAVVERGRAFVAFAFMLPRRVRHRRADWRSEHEAQDGKAELFHRSGSFALRITFRTKRICGGNHPAGARPWALDPDRGTA